MSWSEIIIILAVGMFVLGPERIPVAVKWVGSTLRTVRTMAAGAQEQLRGEFGPEIDELRRQIEDLQSLKEIQELRALRDLNPRSMLTKNLLGEEFSGGMSGFLGLNQPSEPATGSGVAPQAAAVSPSPGPTPATPDPAAGTDAALPTFSGSSPVTINEPPVTIDSPVTADEPPVAVNLAKPVDDDAHDTLGGPGADRPGRHAAATSFDDDAT